MYRYKDNYLMYKLLLFVRERERSFDIRYYDLLGEECSNGYMYV